MSFCYDGDELGYEAGYERPKFQKEIIASVSDDLGSSKIIYQCDPCQFRGTRPIPGGNGAEDYTADGHLENGVCVEGPAPQVQNGNSGGDSGDAGAAPPPPPPPVNTATTTATATPPPPPPNPNEVSEEDAKAYTEPYLGPPKSDKYIWKKPGSEEYIIVNGQKRLKLPKAVAEQFKAQADQNKDDGWERDGQGNVKGTSSSSAGDGVHYTYYKNSKTGDVIVKYKDGNEVDRRPASQVKWDSDGSKIQWPSSVQAPNPVAPGATSPNQVAAVQPNAPINPNSPEGRLKTDLDLAVKQGKISKDDADAFWKTFPNNQFGRRQLIGNYPDPRPETKIGGIMKGINKKEPDPKAKSDFKAMVQESIAKQYLHEMRDAKISPDLAYEKGVRDGILPKGKTPPKDWPRYPQPIKVDEFGGANPEMKSGDGAKALDQLKAQNTAKKLTVDSVRKENDQANDLEAYLSHVPPEKREGVKSFLKTVEWTDDTGKKQYGFMDEKGRPKGDWNHQNFGRTLFDIPKNLDGTPGEVPADLSQTKPIVFNGGEKFDPSRMDNKGPLGDFQRAVAKGDFAGAQGILDKADPLTKSVGRQILSTSYVERTHQILMKDPRYSFSEKDAIAIEVSRGLRNADGSIKTDLDPSKAQEQLGLVGGLGDTGQPRISRERLMTEAATFYKDQNTSGFAHIGLNEDDGPKYAFSRGYFGDEDSLPEGTLAKMREDYEDLKKVEGDKDASAKLATKWKDIGSKEGGIPSTSPGMSQYYAMKGAIRDIYQPNLQGQPDPRVQEARQQLYGAQQQKKSLDPKQRELELRALELQQNKETAAKTDERERLKLKYEIQRDKERLDFDKWKSDKDIQLKEKEMQLHLITTVIQVMAQLVTSAVQVLGQVGASHIAGGYQTQAALLQPKPR